jgi:hypothetical protein
LLSSDREFLDTEQVPNDSISSAHVTLRGAAKCVPDAGQVALFTNANFLGDCVVLAFGDYPGSEESIGLPNDSISSVRVGPGAQVELFKDAGFAGDSILLTSSDSFLDGDQVGSDDATSAKVQPLGTTDCPPGPNQVSLFANANYLGRCTVKDMGTYNTMLSLGLSDADVSSVRVGSGVQACTYDQEGLGGTEVTYAADNASVPGHSVYSATVQSRGTSCPTGGGVAGVSLGYRYASTVPCTGGVTFRLVPVTLTGTVGLTTQQFVATSTVTVEPSAGYCHWSQLTGGLRTGTWSIDVVGDTVNGTCQSTLAAGNNLVNMTAGVPGCSTGLSFPYCSNGIASADAVACLEAVPAGCTFNGTSIASGASVTAYAAASVPFGASCASEQRTCNDGALSGSFAFSACTAAAPASCTFNNQMVAHGQSVTAYSTSSMPPCEPCEPQRRTCSNGVLSGDFTFASCTTRRLKPGMECP